MFDTDVFPPEMLFLIIFIVVVSAITGVVKTWLFFRSINQVSSEVETALSQLEDSLEFAVQQIELGRRLPKSRVNELQVMWGKYSSNMRYADRIGRERYEHKCSELMSKAAEAGISFTPPRG